MYVKTLATAGIRLDTIGPFYCLSTNCPAHEIPGWNMTGSDAG